MPFATPRNAGAPSTGRSGEQAPTIILTRESLHEIVYDMGWDEEDADAFWELAVRESQNPGSLAQGRRDEFARLVADR